MQAREYGHEKNVAFRLSHTDSWRVPGLDSVQDSTLQCVQQFSGDSRQGIWRASSGHTFQGMAKKTKKTTRFGEGDRCDRASPS